MTKFAELLIALLKALGIDVAVKDKIKDEKINRADEQDRKNLDEKDNKAAADTLRRKFNH